MNKFREIKNKFDKKQISINDEDKEVIKNIDKELLSEDISSDELNIHFRNHTRDITSKNGSLRDASEEADDKVNKHQLEQNLSSKLNRPISKDNKTTENDYNEVKILQNKLAQSNTRLYECKNTCIFLRQELNKARKIICREIGDDVTIASLSHNNLSSGWKGRSQQIQQLQQKIIELQHKLNNHNQKSSSERNIVNKKRQQNENSSRELRQAEVTSENNKKKLEAARARIKVLENDLCLTKNNLILINEKKLHDEQLIEALNGQLRAVESRYRDKEIEIKHQRDKLQQNCDELKNELIMVKFQVDKLRQKIGERETEIDTLRLNKSGRACESLLSVSTNVNQTMNSIDDDSMIISGRNKDPNEYVILGLAAESERERLLELVTLLNQRLDKERIDTDHVSELLRCEKNKNTKLEKKLRQLEMERVKMSKINTGYCARSSKSLGNVTSSREQLNSEEIADKLELLEEKCLALKTRLTTVQHDKESDLRIYKHMLENTKKIFQDACRNGTLMARGHSTLTI
ncbi:hypothetical protein PV326_007297 [Microctonus aethiopoides]|nr:hypothetical protein PV326_007297 [Microctonus aethiopoides]